LANRKKYFTAALLGGEALKLGLLTEGPQLLKAYL
jgi:hypothetical protein